jgi:hypothetical protein
MNNESFRNLLKSGSLSGKAQSKDGKSSKEIAREAVEEEFRERRSKRGRDEDYLSDDEDGDEDEDDDNARDSKKKSKKEEEKELAEDEAKAARAKEKKNKKIKYRDRAKERRDGRSDGFQDTHGMAKNLDEDMSKFLGGDEEHTHLVKGLDRTLAEKVRRDEMGNQADTHGEDLDLDLDQIMEEASAKAKEKKKATLAFSKKSVSELTPNASTTLTSGMLSYLKRLEESRKTDKESLNYSMAGNTASLTGQSISRTTLSFSLDANVRDREKSWELPEEKMMSITQFERIQSRRICTTCTPLDSNLISKIKSVFSSLIEQRDKHEATKAGLKKKKNIISKASKEESPPPDSDDDIFADAGNYKPPSKEVPID